jgi:hypothetical protein
MLHMTCLFFWMKYLMFSVISCKKWYFPWHIVSINLGVTLGKLLDEICLKYVVKCGISCP